MIAPRKDFNRGRMNTEHRAPIRCRSRGEPTIHIRLFMMPSPKSPITNVRPSRRSKQPTRSIPVRRSGGTTRSIDENGGGPGVRLRKRRA